MEYIIKENSYNFGMAVTLEFECPIDGGCSSTTECPRLGCCPRGGRAVPPWEI